MKPTLYPYEGQQLTARAIALTLAGTLSYEAVKLRLRKGITTRAGMLRYDTNAVKRKAGQKSAQLARDGLRKTFNLPIFR